MQQKVGAAQQQLVLVLLRFTNQVFEEGEETVKHVALLSVIDLVLPCIIRIGINILLASMLGRDLNILTHFGKFLSLATLEVLVFAAYPHQSSKHLIYSRDSRCVCDLSN